MLTVSTADDTKTTTFKFIGSDVAAKSKNLITNNESLLNNSSDGDSGLDTCSFYDGPSDSTIVAFGESYSGTESCGSIAMSTGGDTCGSIASSSSFSSFSSVSTSSSSSSSSSGCSYSC